MAFNFSTIQLPGRTTKTPEIAPHRDVHRITFRSRRGPRDLHNQHLAVMI